MKRTLAKTNACFLICKQCFTDLKDRNLPKIYHYGVISMPQKPYYFPLCLVQKSSPSIIMYFTSVNTLLLFLKHTFLPLHWKLMIIVLQFYLSVAVFSSTSYSWYSSQQFSGSTHHSEHFRRQNPSLLACLHRQWYSHSLILASLSWRLEKVWTRFSETSHFLLVKYP